MRVVVLGTGTNVGKTHVTAALARGLSTTVSVLALKPIESGVAPGALGDAGVIANAARHSPMLSSWRLERGVSPHLAARLAGTRIDVAAVAAWVRQQEDQLAPQISLIETAGGAFSPLGVGATNADLALALEPSLWILVAPDALGVLHDVAATLRALPRAPDALLLSTSRGVDPSSGTNSVELGYLGVARVLETLGDGATDCPATVAWLRAHPSFMSSPK